VPGAKAVALHRHATSNRGAEGSFAIPEQFSIAKSDPDTGASLRMIGKLKGIIDSVGENFAILPPVTWRRNRKS
jgi:hypothetical protein